jgi:hypothetical protein
MATLSQESEHNLLPPADLLGEIERLREDLSAERDRTLHLQISKIIVVALSVMVIGLPRKINGECCFPC